MPVVNAFGSIAGKPIISCRTALEALAENGIDDSSIRFKANSYRCPISETPGEGHFLMLRRDIEKLKANESVSVKIGAGPAVVTFPALLPLRAWRILPGASHDKNALYLLELVDRRFVCSMSAINKRFNLRQPNSAADDFLDDTCNGGAPYSWLELAQQLWQANNTNQIGAWQSNRFDATGLTSTPENFWFEGVSAWSAMNDFAGRCGRQVRYNPINDSFFIVRMGATAADPESGQDAVLPAASATNDIKVARFGGATDSGFPMNAKSTPRTNTDLLLEDCECFAWNINHPLKVAVMFPVADHDQAAYEELAQNSNSGIAPSGRFYTIEVADTVNADTGPVGSRKLIHDSLVARWTSPATTTPDNLAELQSRAAEVAAAYYDSLRIATPARLVYSGCRKLWPGPTIQQVTWADFGNGWTTTVERWWPKIGGREPMPFNNRIQLLLGKTSIPIPKGESGGVFIYSGTTKGEEEYTGKLLTIKNRWGDLGSDKWVAIAWLNGGWDIVIGEC